MPPTYTVRGEQVSVDELGNHLVVRPAGRGKPGAVGEAICRWRGMAFVASGADELPDDVARMLSRAGWVLVRPAPERSAEGLPPPAALGRLYRSASGEVVIGTGRLTVRLREELDSKQSEAALSRHRLEVVRKLKFAPNLFEVKVADDPADALQVSSETDQDADFVYAEPQMIQRVGSR